VLTEEARDEFVRDLQGRLTDVLIGMSRAYTGAPVQVVESSLSIFLVGKGYTPTVTWSAQTAVVFAEVDSMALVGVPSTSAGIFSRRSNNPTRPKTFSCRGGLSRLRIGNRPAGRP
jgi:hypothetical protein